MSDVPTREERERIRDYAETYGSIQTESDTKTLLGALGRVEAERDAVLDALRGLYDWQNGCPLLGRKWETGWGNAMEAAEKVLGIPPEKSSIGELTHRRKNP